MTGSASPRYVTDGGLETELIFHDGRDLPGFAAFPLLEQEEGRRRLSGYYDGYADIAVAAGAGLLLESPTWRANPDCGAQLGYSAEALRRINQGAIEFLQQRRERQRDRLDDVVVSGTLGPRGDGYVPDRQFSADQAADYHSAQLQAFADAGAEFAAAYTLADPAEAIGIVRAAQAAGLPIAISFTVETDGRLPNGMTVADAIAAVDADAAPDFFLLNCAHPTHVAPGLAGAEADEWRRRIQGMRYNASVRSHAQLDEAVELDSGDATELARSHRAIAGQLPQLSILGGCCGTDARHVAALWGVG